MTNADNADAMLTLYEKLISALPQGDPLQKSIKHIMVPWKLKARRWAKKSRPRPIEIGMVHRNEQINIAAICAGHQILMCDNEMVDKKEYYLLVPMKGIETLFGIYKRNDFGEQFQKIINREWGNDLEKFPCKYVAQVRRRPLLAKNIQEFWEELEREGLFDFWDPKGGPVKWCEDHLNPHLPILRVFEIDRDLRSFVDYYKTVTNPPFLIKSGIKALAIPVLTEEEFNQQFQRLWNIFQNPM